MLIEYVRQTIKKHNLIEKGGTVLVAVSGGPDSMALLHVLHALREEFDIKLYVAHLDHGLRPDSAGDRRFVENAARSLRVACVSKRINVGAVSHKGSLEEIARNCRLDFLARTARTVNADSIALGHTRNDQAETVLMRLLRGTGLYGLSSILVKRRFGNVTLIRPLLCAARKEIIAYLKKNKVVFRTDRSNSDNKYFRNKIRNALLPLLEKEYNKSIREVLSTVAETAGYDYDYLNLQAEKAFKKMGGCVKLGAFMKLHPALQRMILRINIAKLQGNTRRITFQHIRELEDLVLNRPMNSIVDLPQGISAIKKRKILFFYMR